MIFLHNFNVFPLFLKTIVIRFNVGKVSSAADQTHDFSKKADAPGNSLLSNKR